MSKFIDITGNRYGKLVVLERVQNDPGGYARFKCLCDCGNITYVRGHNLKTGQVKSCGCLRHIPTNATHKLSKTSLYKIWAGMKQRCYNPNNPRFNCYGERGICICDDWYYSFENFRDWAYANGYQEGLSIERLDNDYPYCPENCIWIPFNQQASNRRMNLQLTINGKTQNLREWCDELNLNYKFVHNRLRCGWDFKRAVSEPKHFEKE